MRRSRNLSLTANLRFRKRCRFRQILGHGILFGNRLPELLCILRLHALPSFFDHRIGNAVLHRRYLRCCRLKRGWWRHHIQLIALQSLAVARVGTRCRIKCKLNRLDILIGLGRNGLNLWTEIIYHRVIGDNIGHILGLADDLHVLSRRHDILRVARSRPMRIADKTISRRSNAVIRIRP